MNKVENNVFNYTFPGNINKEKIEKEKINEIENEGKRRQLTDTLCVCGRLIWLGFNSIFADLNFGASVNGSAK